MISHDYQCRVWTLIICMLLSVSSIFQSKPTNSPYPHLTTTSSSPHLNSSHLIQWYWNDYKLIYLLVDEGSVAVTSLLQFASLENRREEVCKKVMLYSLTHPLSLHHSLTHSRPHSLAPCYPSQHGSIDG
jgi:hypothetical protein